MKNWSLVYFGIAAIWLLITMAPIPEHLVNQMGLVKIALLIIVIIMAFKKRR